jgi:hypothetical protein
VLDVDGILAVVSRVSGHHAGYSTSLEGYGVGMGAPLTEDHEIYKGLYSGSWCGENKNLVFGNGCGGWRKYWIVTMKDPTLGLIIPAEELIKAAHQ